jgi:hypothetical protein
MTRRAPPASMDLFYTAGPEGYVDYPTMNAAG